MDSNGWLKIVLEKMEKDIAEVKSELKLLREERAWTKGAFWVATIMVSGFATLAFHLLEIILRV